MTAMVKATARRVRRSAKTDRPAFGEARGDRVGYASTVTFHRVSPKGHCRQCVLAGMRRQSTFCIRIQIQKTPEFMAHLRDMPHLYELTARETRRRPRFRPIPAIAVRAKAAGMVLHRLHAGVSRPKPQPPRPVWS
jgi:hypothetical protein